MSTNIPPVQTNAIEHGVLIDLTLDNNTYFISNCYKTITWDGNEYVALAGFLNISDIQNNISNANNEIQLSLSAIPSTYIAETLGQPIKGGEVNIYRAFFDYTTKQIITGEVYRRFTGIISNFSVQEDLDVGGTTPEVTHTITIIASSIMGVLENKISGRRTNKQDFGIEWPEIANDPLDPSMDRVDTLFNSSFDFGKKYVGQAASTVNGSGGDSGGGGGGDSGGGGGDGGE
jgi:uncharacterized membrane protein YgcG